MTRPFRSKSQNRPKAKTTLTLADFKNKQGMRHRMTLEDAYEIACGYKKADEKTFALAMQLVEKDDREFAASLKKSAAPHQRPNLQKLITLYDAYEIAGGYKQVDKATFNKAMKMVEADDAHFAASLRQMHKNNQIKTLQSVEDLKTSPEHIASNADFIYNAYENDKQSHTLKNAVLEDEDIKEALSNTPIYGTDSATNEDFALDKRANEESTNALYENSKAETLYNLVDDEDFAQLDDHSKTEKLKSEVKHSFLHTLTHLRLSTQIKDEANDVVAAIKEGNESFFARKIGKIHDAFNFKKEVKVSGNSMLATFRKTQEKVSLFAKGLTELAQKSKDKSKKLLSKAAVSMHKAAVYMVIVSTLASPVLSSCSHTPQQRAPQPNGGIPQTEQTVRKDSIEKTPEQQPVAQQEEKKATAIMVPHAWEASMGITEAQWTRLQSYWGSQAKYDKFYQRISEDMLQDGGMFAGKTREQVLFQYERLSSWNLTNHQATIAKLDAFFDDCGGQITSDDANILNDVLPNGAIKDVNGTDCSRVTGKDIECGEDGILHTQKVDCGCDEKVEEQTNTGENKKEKEQDVEFVEIQGTSTTVTQEIVEQTRANPDIKILKANNIQGGKVIGTTNSEAVSNIKTKDATIVIGNDKKTAEADLFGDDVIVTETGGSTVETGNAETGDIEFIEVQGSSRVVTSTQQSSENSNDLFGDNVVVATTGSSTVETGDTIAIHSEDEITFVEVQGSTHVATSAERVKADSVAVITSSDITVDTKEQIIADSEEVAAGTPAADNVPERGGYMNTGLTERQYKRTETFFKDKSGNNAFDVYLDRVTDDMRAKGGIFEGLSKAEALYTVQQMVAWSNDQHGKFAKQITTTINYFKECDDTIAKSELSSIKDIVDKVNENGTIDGVTGKTNKVVKYFQANDCGESGTYNVSENSGTPDITNPSGEKFPRFFKKLINVLPEPIFVEVQGSNSVVEVQETVQETVNPNIVVVKANNLEAGTVIATGVSADKAANIQTKDVNIVLGTETKPVSVSEQQVTAARKRVEAKFSKKAAKKAEKARAKAAEEAKRNSITGNLDLDKYLISDKKSSTNG